MVTATTLPIASAPLPAVLPAVQAGDINTLATQIGMTSVADLSREERMGLLNSILFAQGITALNAFSTAAGQLATAAAALSQSIAADAVVQETLNANAITAANGQTTVLQAVVTALNSMATATAALAPKT